MLQAVPYFRVFVAGFSPQRPGFIPSVLHVGFVVWEKPYYGRVSSERFGFALIS
jgi:hypothetical protein